MWRYQVSNNQVQDIHATHGNDGVVAVVDARGTSTHKPGKSKRLFGSLTTGLKGTSCCGRGLFSMEISRSQMESDQRRLRRIDSIPAERELPAPAWASLIVRDAINR